jgi:glycosyltransferase involved in cell wall biosynthesis
MNVSSISVVICTYNRAERLGRTLATFAALPRPDGYNAEIIVVDNNSSDPMVMGAIESAARESSIPVIAAREPRQGKSFALNRALSLARGDVLALTDDDVVPDVDWLDRIVAAFRAGDIVFAGGKVLPSWGAPPPPYLLTKRAQAIWGPLALVDYGDEPFDFTATALMQRRPVGANLAFRRDAIEAIGGWRTDLGKIDNTLISGEDHEIFFRLREAGQFRGRYDPLIRVVHDVPPSRLRRSYFRRWFFFSGLTRARMRDDLYEWPDLAHARLIAGVPAFLYRQLIQECVEFVRVIPKGTLERLIQQLQILRLIGLMVGCRAERRTGGRSCAGSSVSDSPIRDANR